MTVGFPASRTGYGQTTYGNTEPQTERATWLRLHEDGTATVYAGKVEYGQGIRTGFAVEVADELRLPLDAVEVILGDTARVPWDMGTFGSQSTARVGPQLRRAAATAREALLALAADHLDLPVADLAAREGVVASEAGASVTYAELLAGREIELEIDDDAALTSSDEFTVMGKRVDAVARVTGETTFTRDVLRDGMAFAAVVRPPSYGARLLEVDSSIAEQLPGVIDVVRDGDLVAVLGESDEAAERAASLVDAQWEEATGQPGRWDMPQLLIDSAQDHFVTQEAGDLDEGFGEADQILEAMYYIPYISITPMEPRAAVAEWDGDALTVWAGAQRPFGLRSELASRFDLEESSVHVLTPDIGGGFGGKSIFAPAAEAARLARVAGRPVRVAYTRAQEQTWATFRPAALIQIKSGFRNDGTLTAWQCDAFHAGRARDDRASRLRLALYDPARPRDGRALRQPPGCGKLPLARRRREPLRARGAHGRDRRSGRRRPGRVAHASPGRAPLPSRPRTRRRGLRLGRPCGQRRRDRPRRGVLLGGLPAGTRAARRGAGRTRSLGARLRAGRQPGRRGQPDGGARS